MKMVFHILIIFIFILHHHLFAYCSITPQLPSSAENHHLCNYEQSLALLQFKKVFTLDIGASSDCDESLLLHPKTVSWNTSTDCCKWGGVICDESTGNVIGLDLSCSQLMGTIETNSSLFQLNHLKSLNLAYNDLYPSPVSSEFVQFTSLTHLNLSSSGFSGQISSDISRLWKLVSLDLAHNVLGFGHEGFHRLIQNLTEIRELHLSDVQINSVLPANLSSSLVHLYLSYAELKGELLYDIFEQTNLVTLDLAVNNELTGRFPKINMNSSSRLEVLSLSGTSLFGELPESIGHLKSLKNLDLWGCRFSGPIPHSVGNLTHITTLYLESNNFTGQVPLTLTNLKQLSSLSLSNNHLTGPIPSNGSGFQNLISFSLENNSLDGTIPSWLFTLPSLRLLYLSDNQLEGPIHEFRYHSLEVIYLSKNKLRGPIPQSISKQLNLTSLSLESNNLSGEVEIGMFSNLKKLEFLSLSYNNLSLITDANATLSNSLVSLRLSSCEIKDLDFLRTVHNLEYLDLSNNKIRGQMPDWALSMWSDTLIQLNLSSNFLTGLNQLPWNKLFYVDLRSNLLSGPLLVPPPNTIIFSISHNKLTGEIPPSICNSSSLNLLDLSDNGLSGIIPQCLIKLSNTLLVLDLQKNALSGSIPDTFSKGSKLRTLNLNGNELWGPIPRSLANCRRLEVLNLGNNRLNGTFPQWLGSLPQLQILVLRSNGFHGPITRTSKTKHLFQKLRVLDLSYNKFIGQLPVRVFKSLKAMMKFDKNIAESMYMGDTYYQDSVTVVIKGQELELVRILTVFTTIDLSNNKFDGEIPNFIGDLNSLRLLNLSHNSFVGRVPSSLGTLSVLESLDLSYNQLVGEIPQQLTNLTFLAVLNLSRNHLVGRIPQGKQFNTFQNDSYSGNLALCGFPLSIDCDEDDAPRPSISQAEVDSDNASGFTWKVVLMGYGCGSVFGIATGSLMFFTRKPKWFIGIVEGGRRKNAKRRRRN